MSSNLVIIDGHSMMHRCFHVGRRYTSPDGREVGALLTLCDQLMVLLKKMTSRHVVMAFDPGGHLHRHDIDADYKANRKPTDPDLLPQFPWVRQAVEALGIRTVCIEGFEADDCIATLVHQARAERLAVWIVGLDKDLYQLVTDDPPPVRMFVMPTKTVVDAKAIEARIGVPPTSALDYYALVGDSSDNITGVKGVGPKAAATLLQAFGSLQGIFDHLDDIPQLDLRGAGRMPLRLLDGKKAAHMAQALLALRTDVPLGLGTLTQSVLWTGPAPDADKVFAGFGDDSTVWAARDLT